MPALATMPTQCFGAAAPGGLDLLFSAPQCAPLEEPMIKRREDGAWRRARQTRKSHQASPLAALLACSGDSPAMRRGHPSPAFLDALGSELANALADGRLECALAMLAGCPALALMPCRKAVFSALHWSCSSERLAPATRALLALGCDPSGYPIPGSAPGERASNTPLRWAISSGSLPALLALISAGARPGLDDLFEACRNAQARCALAIAQARPDLSPFESPGPGLPHCFQALFDAAAALSPSDRAARPLLEEALCVFESRALLDSAPESAAAGRGGSGSKRL